jgi:hypothetical protein
MILLGVCFRVIGVWLSTLKLSLSAKEKRYVFISFTPKATVQATLGPIPLALGFAFGQEILLIAITSIFLTATIASILIDTMTPTLYDIK